VTGAGIGETRELLAQGKMTVSEHVQEVLTAINEVNPSLAAYVTVATTRFSARLCG